MLRAEVLSYFGSFFFKDLNFYFMPKRLPVTETNIEEELALIGISYFKNKALIKELESKCKDSRKPLEDFLTSNGKNTPSGGKIYVLSYADSDIILKHTSRTTKVLLPEAIDVLKENGLDECIESVPTIREDVIERLIKEGAISNEVLSKIYALKDSYAFSVDLKNKFDGDGV